MLQQILRAFDKPPLGTRKPNLMVPSPKARKFRCLSDRRKTKPTILTLVCLFCAVAMAFAQNEEGGKEVPEKIPNPVIRVRNPGSLDDLVKIVEAMESLFPDATVKKINPSVLLVVPREGKSLSRDSIEAIADAVKGWDRALQPNPLGGRVSRVIQLFNLRNAQGIAEALNGTTGNSLKLKSLGDDQLVILGDEFGSEAAIDRVHRLVAVLDQPRPQITLQLWTLQVSDRSAQVIEDKFEGARSLIRRHDEILRYIYSRSWHEVYELQKRAGDKFFDETVYPYLHHVYPNCKSPDRYCLGYDLGLEGSPSLSRMLIVLALSQKPWENASKALENMANLQRWPGRLKAETADQSSAKLPANAACGNRKPVQFPSLVRTKEELEFLLSPDGAALRSLRAALLDYLFHYKWSQAYPERFSAHNLQRSAGRVDGLFGPVVQAFSNDIQVFIEGMQCRRGWPTGPKPKGGSSFFKKVFLNLEPTLEGLASSGHIKVVALSSSPAKVQGDTVSFFDMTPPPEFNLQAEGGTGVSAVAPFTAGSIALRALQAPQPVTVQVDRGLTIEITPYSLAEASAAELHINLTVGEPSAPKVVEGSTSGHLLDRIAKIELQTRVRVPGVRLFEVSNFALDVQVPRPDGIVPIIGHVSNGVFGRIPGLGGFFKWKREPATVYHRNFVVVNAVIAPTAADLALGLRFHNDILPNRDGLKRDAAKARSCLNELLRSHQGKIHHVLGLPIGSKVKHDEEACQ